MMNILDNLNAYLLQQQQQQQQKSLNVYNHNINERKNMIRNNNPAYNDEEDLIDNNNNNQQQQQQYQQQQQQQQSYQQQSTYDQISLMKSPPPGMKQQASSRSVSPPIFKKSKKTTLQEQELFYSSLNQQQSPTTQLRRSNSSSYYQDHIQQQQLYNQTSPIKPSLLAAFNNTKINSYYFSNEGFNQHENSAFSTLKTNLNYLIDNNTNSKSNAATANASSPAAKSYKSVYSNDESKCHVCGDKSTGSHFGGISCESCKAFFRRSVQNDRYVDYKCTYQNLCEMNINTRKICQSCRYKACLNIGMRPKWVLSDSERLQKYGSRRRKFSNITLPPTPTQTATIKSPPSVILPPPPSVSSVVPSIDSIGKKMPFDDDNNSILSAAGGSIDFDMKSLPPQSPINNLNRLNISGTSFNNCKGSNHMHNNPSNHSLYHSHSVSSNSSETNSPLNNSSCYESNKEQETTAGEGSSSVVKEYLESEFYKHGIDSMDMFSLSIHEYDKILIDKLVYAYYYARKAHELNTSSFNSEFTSATKMNDPAEMQQSSKITAANFIRKPVERLVTFSKLIPDFRNLAVGDQLLLLRSSAMEIIICSSISLFDKNTNSVKNMVSRDRNIEAPDKQAIQLQLLRKLWPPEVFDATIKYLKSMVELNIDEATLVLYITLILFSPDRRDLSNRIRVFDLQTRYSRLLYKYLLKERPVEDADQLYKVLLLKLIELRNLHELHSSILVDVDVTQLDGFPQAIIKSELEDNSKHNIHKQQQQQQQNLLNKNVNSNASSYDLSPSFSYSTTPSTSQTDFE